MARQPGARLGLTQAQSDRYAGGWVVEAFQRHGIQVLQDAEAKSQVYLGALPALTAKRVDLLDVPRVRAQLAGLERRRRAGGRDVVDHPPAGFDDLANAVCGVVVLTAARGTGGDEVLAANLRDTPRARILDEREFELLGRGGY